MRKLYFLVPGTTQRFGGGGLWAELKILKLAQPLCEAAIVTYQQREADTLFLDDLLAAGISPQEVIFVVSWGFHVPKLVQKLRQYPVVYHAHSSGYGFSIPARVPIWCVSRNTVGYWGQKALNAPIAYLPNHISEAFCDRNQIRDIDVLVQARKSSPYLLTQLVPALEDRVRVVLLDHYVEDLAELFNRAKVYLYDSAHYWGQQGVSEGFGLPPLEALACGCQVFSSVNGAIADYLDPGINAQKLSVYSTAYDIERILAAVQHPVKPLPESVFQPYRAPAIQQRLAILLQETNQFFDHIATHPRDIPPAPAAILGWAKRWARRLKGWL